MNDYNVRIPRARFHIADHNSEFVYVVDENGPVSVTNDAETVVAYVNAKFPGRRIIYRDTEYRWDELEHCNGVFLNFKFLEKKNWPVGMD